LQQVNDIARSLSSAQDPAIISRLVTQALVERFGCAFARIWLVESDQTALRLVASSGLYTHLDGSFARVPMGTYKVGKIAQNRIPFLSNHLADEAWVKDRQWAIDNHIQGFAGYPLVTEDAVLGVLACFSHTPFAPEFLEVLQVLCMTLTVALHGAMQTSTLALAPGHLPSGNVPLSEQLARVLDTTQLTLMGTERPLRPALEHCFWQATDMLKRVNCSYCRLTYRPLSVALEAVAIAPLTKTATASDPAYQPAEAALTLIQSHFADLKQVVTSLGGTLHIQPVMQNQACQISVLLPSDPPEIAVHIQCQPVLLHQGLVQLVYQAGFRVADSALTADVRLTDQVGAVDSLPTVWIRHGLNPASPPASTTVDITTTPEQLRHAVEHARSGHPPAVDPQEAGLSVRERQIMQLLAAGKRDREIAQELFISESTVKFHINNSLGKLQAKNRYQGVYQATLWGWI
jgi:DNA-binding CsgD family transcriptional regulator